jgi:hypothetical protein
VSLITAQQTISTSFPQGQGIAGVAGGLSWRGANRVLVSREILFEPENAFLQREPDPTDENKTWITILFSVIYG